MSKITANRKGKGLIRTELLHRYLPRKLPRFLKVILGGAFQNLILTDTNIFNLSNNVTSITSINAFYQDTFLCT